MLIDFKADINFSSKGRGSAIHLAVASNQLSTVKMLIEMNANVNIQNADLETSLHIACKNPDLIQILQLLVSNGANTRITDKNNEPPIFTAIRMKNKGAINALITSGVDFTHINKLKQTIVHVACEIGSVEIVRRVLDYCYDVNSQDIYGNTPLHYATLNDSIELINALLARGADATKKNAKGKSPLFYCSNKCTKMYKQHFANDYSYIVRKK